VRCLGAVGFPSVARMPPPCVGRCDLTKNSSVARTPPPCVGFTFSELELYALLWLLPPSYHLPKIDVYCDSQFILNEA